MEPLTNDFDDPVLLLPPIAGGDGEDEDGEVITSHDGPPAGDEAGGDDSGEESPEEGAEGEETAEGDGTEGDEGQEGEGAGEQDAAGAAPRSVPYSRFKEVNDVVRELRDQNRLLISRLPSGDGNGNGGRAAQGAAGDELDNWRPAALPETYAELDKGMRGYMMHYVEPLAVGLLKMQRDLGKAQSSITDYSDQAGFYRGPGRGLNEQQAQLVEQTRQALSQKLNQPVERSDALLFLRGHPKHGKLFVDRQAVANRELANGVTAARRVAGKLGGRGAVARRGPGEPVDLNALPRAERLKVFERVHGNTPL